MPVQQFLDLSTDHLSADDVALLDRAACGEEVGVHVRHRSDAGYLINPSISSLYATDEGMTLPEFLLARGFSRTFGDVMAYSEENGLFYVNFDASAELDDNFGIAQPTTAPRTEP